MTNLEVLRRRLTDAVDARTASNQKLADDIVKYGACDRAAWLADPMKVDAKGYVAQVVLSMLDEGKLTMAEIRDELRKRADQETSWLIPTNSDAHADLYKIQAMLETYQWVAYVVANPEG